MRRRRGNHHRLFSPVAQSIKSTQSKPKIANLSLNQAQIGFVNEAIMLPKKVVQTEHSPRKLNKLATSMGSQSNEVEETSEDLSIENY